MHMDLHPMELDMKRPVTALLLLVLALYNSTSLQLFFHPVLVIPVIYCLLYSISNTSKFQFVSFQRSKKNMINTGVLIKMVRKWKRVAFIGRKRISSPTTTYGVTSSCSSTSSSVAPKGHFVVYSADKQRFVVPLSYLNNEIVSALFDKSEEELGLPRNGHITLPVDSYMLEYIISLISRGLAKEQENALLLFVVTTSCSSSLTSMLDEEIRCQPIYVHS